MEAYRQYLANECGYIQLDGLPADSDVGARRLRLENLFVPLHLDVNLGNKKQNKGERLTVGSLLAQSSRLALLAAPGGGKSTLLKRLAVAYADHERLVQAADDLPNKGWLPLFFRCRELRTLARGSFSELLDSLSQREPVRQFASLFRTFVDQELVAGRILLLVDGLDEISDPGDRAAFVCTLRTALQAYPNTAMVLTSREAGFRHVAAHLAPVCTNATLSPFEAEDIRRLSVAWHQEVVGDTEKVRFDAEQLASTIIQNDRIRSLAVNPLLLTTLLLVKRWVGSLPIRRAILYGKAVEVLLMTWNTEGHDPIPEEEALPQLCYVASAMMFEGVQKISRPRLATLLQNARESLPTELGYVKDTVDQFIHRVEDRSSLLMMTGYDIEDGRLVEFFEFRHLTFQEFLTARAMIEGWHFGRKDDDTLTSVLEPHFEKEAWREIIPLSAVLGGKATELLIQRLTEKVRSLNLRKFRPDYPPYIALANCLADEAAARPETIRAAIKEIVRFGSGLHGELITPMLVRGRYGSDFRDEAARAFLSAEDNLGNFGDALLMAVWWQTLENEDKDGYICASIKFNEMLNDTKEINRCEGASGLGYLCSKLYDGLNQSALAECAESIRSTVPKLLSMLSEGTMAERCSATFALESVGACRVWTDPIDEDIIGKLFKVWQTDPDETIQHLSARAVASQPLVSRDEFLPCNTVTSSEILSLFQKFDQLDNQTEKTAVLIVAWYLRTICDQELVEHANKILKTTKRDKRFCNQTLTELLGYLKEIEGGEVLDDE